MRITIKRIHTTPDSIDGTLYIGDRKVCDCVENLSTSLPEGSYPIVINRCRHYQRKMPCIVVDVSSILVKCHRCPKMRFINANSTLSVYCPQIKIGNGVHNRSDGSIIIGKRLIPGVLIHSEETFNRLIDRLDKAQNRGEELSLLITNY